MNFVPKYPAEFILEFQSIDRFVYRIADLYQMSDLAGTELLERLDQCHIYLLGKRPRLAIVPESIRTSRKNLRLQVEYRLGGKTYRANVLIPRSVLRSEEARFEASPYPHRELISFDVNGAVLGYTLLANFAHLFESVLPEAKDLEIVYVGKGLRKSAQDRLENHTKLQQILAEINSNEPDMEVFALVYAFNYRKHLLATKGLSPEIVGDAANQHNYKALNYQPTLDEQVALIEAVVISYFRPSRYNTHYLDFPDRRHRILKDVYEADFAIIIVQLDNTNIGEQRIYSKHKQPKSTHYIVVDFRHAEGRISPFAQSQVYSEVGIPNVARADFDTTSEIAASRTRIRKLPRALWMITLVDVLVTYIFCFAANAVLSPPSGPHAPPTYWLLQAWVYGLIAPVAGVAAWRGTRQVVGAWFGRPRWWRLVFEAAAVGGGCALLLSPLQGGSLSLVMVTALQVAAITGALGLVLTGVNYPVFRLLQPVLGRPAPAD